MTPCGLRPCLNTSGNCTLHQGLNISEVFPFWNVKNLETHVLGGFVILTSLFGMVGNGIVLRYLCFLPKSDPFIFITHLAVADFGLLFVLSAYFSLFFIVYWCGRSHSAVSVLSLCLSAFNMVMFCASALFLAAISADRCVAVFFPLWHRCHRPKSLPTIVSALLWPLAFVAGGLTFYYDTWLGGHKDHKSGIVLFFLFDSDIVLSSLALFIRVYCFSHLGRRGRLLKVILFSLAVFIITMVPQHFLLVLIKDIKTAYLFNSFLTALNSSANPIIYFFVGRLRSPPSRRSVGAVLQKVFREDEDSEGQPSCSKSSVRATY